MGRAGGFASAAHRANVANMRAAAAHRRVLTRKVVGGATRIVVATATGLAVGHIVGKGLGKPSTTVKLYNIDKQLRGRKFMPPGPS
jgi:hypothetical protein